MRTAEELFKQAADHVSHALARPWAFGLAILGLVVWLAIGPTFGFSKRWEAIFDSVVGIVTFLMLFFLQHSQNRDTKAIQLKLNELLRAVEGARESSFVNLEDRVEDELDEVKEVLAEECQACRSPEEHRRHMDRMAAAGLNGPGRSTPEREPGLPPGSGR